MSLNDQLIQWQADLLALSSEIILISCALVILIVGLFKVPDWALKVLYGVSLLAVLFFWQSSEIALFEGFLVKTIWNAALIKILIGSSLLLVLYGERVRESSSYYFLILIVLIGAIFLNQSRQLLLIYLCIEMVSYGSYILTNFSFRKVAYEASLKYLLFGGVSSAIMLFGISLLYGTSGGLMLSEIAMTSPLAKLGYFFFLAGALFKISVVPYHIWVPNVYQGAPVGMAAFFSIVPKLAGFVFLSNVLEEVEFGKDLILVLGLLTILAGTFGALRQTNVRRLIAYGAIAHSGFILPLLVLGIDKSMFLWYAVIYAIMNLAAFHFLSFFEKNNIHDVEDYWGFGKTAPLVGIAFTGVLLSLIGIPPFAGFIAKWFVFISLWQEYSELGEPIMLAYLLIGVLSTILALFYYLKVPFVMFMKSSAQEMSLSLSGLTKILFILWLVTLLAGFIYPDFFRIT